MKTEIIESDKLVHDAVALIESAAAEAITARGRFLLSLSGGNTPKPVYAELARRDHDWSKWVITFGDERCVPPEDKESNFRMVNEAWFLPGKVPASSTWRMQGELDPAAGALDYENSLRHLSDDGAWLLHDLVLLGMGPDGHTASLFPGTPALEEKARWVVENYVPKFSMWRLTFTYPLLNASRHVCFLLSRKGKESVLEDIMSNRGEYPCRGIHPAQGQLTWLIGE